MKKNKNKKNLAGGQDGQDNNKNLIHNFRFHRDGSNGLF
jgi:hypothetical protein